MSEVNRPERPRFMVGMYTYQEGRDSRVDRALRLVPDDTMKAIAWLTK